MHSVPIALSQLLLCANIVYSEDPHEFDSELWASDPWGFLQGADFPSVSEVDERYLLGRLGEDDVRVAQVARARELTKSGVSPLVTAPSHPSGIAPVSPGNFQAAPPVARKLTRSDRQDADKRNARSSLAPDRDANSAADILDGSQELLGWVIEDTPSKRVRFDEELPTESRLVYDEEAPLEGTSELQHIPTGALEELQASPELGPPLKRRRIEAPRPDRAVLEEQATREATERLKAYTEKRKKIASALDKFRSSITWVKTSNGQSVPVKFTHIETGAWPYFAATASSWWLEIERASGGDSLRKNTLLYFAAQQLCIGVLHADVKRTDLDHVCSYENADPKSPEARLWRGVMRVVLYRSKDMVGSMKALAQDSVIPRSLPESPRDEFAVTLAQQYLEGTVIAQETSREFIKRLVRLGEVSDNEAPIFDDVSRLRAQIQLLESEVVGESEQASIAQKPLKMVLELLAKRGSPLFEEEFFGKLSGPAVAPREENPELEGFNEIHVCVGLLQAFDEHIRSSDAYWICLGKGIPELRDYLTTAAEKKQPVTKKEIQRLVAAAGVVLAERRNSQDLLALVATAVHFGLITDEPKVALFKSELLKRLKKPVAVVPRRDLI